MALLLMAWRWQPMPQVLWSVRDPAGIIILYTVFGLGWILVVVSTFLINHFDFSGLAQVYAYLRGEAYRPPTFKTPFLYQYVRHPMMTGLLIGLWATPRMTAGHLLFAASMTAYILIGVSLEERSLLRTFGKAYEDYRSRTPKFLPFSRGMRRAGGMTLHMSETTRSRLFRFLLNCWPALRGSGMRVTYVAPGMREIHVNLSLTLRTLNALGTIFGGSIFAACDPWFSIMLLRQLGPGYIVWDKAASIQFKKPGRGKLFGRFAIDPAEVGEIMRLLEIEHSVDRVYHADLVASDGAVVASVEKVVYVRRGDRKQQTSNPILRLVHHTVMRV
jgi:protein-S-isoprenylcysteine O-methyltransferase Ste14/acyl-coenzyme A thioesterase PaaI-like protein